MCWQLVYATLRKKNSPLPLYIPLPLNVTTSPDFWTFTESVLDCTVHDVLYVAHGWWNRTWHLRPCPSTPDSPTYLRKHIHTICQVAWHISFKAALKAFLLGVHLMKSALKALFPLADTSQPSEGPWPGKNKQRETKRKHFFYRPHCTEPSTFNMCQEPLPSSNTGA